MEVYVDGHIRVASDG